MCHLFILKIARALADRLINLYHNILFTTIYLLFLIRFEVGKINSNLNSTWVLTSTLLRLSRAILFSTKMNK